MHENPSASCERAIDEVVGSADISRQPRSNVLQLLGQETDWGKMRMRFWSSASRMSWMR